MIFPVFDFLTFNADLVTLLVLLCLPPPMRIFLSLKRRLNELAPMVEKLVVRLLVAAVMAVMMSINAKIPSAMMATVMAVRNLLLTILRQESERVSLNVIYIYCP